MRLCSTLPATNPEREGIKSSHNVSTPAACPGSRRLERCLRSVKPNISRTAATIGTASTHKIHLFASSLLTVQGCA